MAFSIITCASSPGCLEWCTVKSINGNIGGSSTAPVNFEPMSDSDKAGAAGAPEPPADVKPDAMLTFMEELRHHMLRHDQELGALQRAISTMAVPAAGSDNGTGIAAHALGAPVAAAAATERSAADRGNGAVSAPERGNAAVEPSAVRGAGPWPPPRSHDLREFSADGPETMDDFFARFERHCAAEYRGTMDDALPLLRSKLSGPVRAIFDANGPRTPYLVVKRRMLEWATRRRGYDEKSAADEFQDATRRPGESLGVFAFRLAALFEDANPEADKQGSPELRRKLLATLPPCAADFLRRQLRYAQINHGTILTWDGLVSYLENEHFESDTGVARDSLFARPTAEDRIQSTVADRPRRPALRRSASLRPRSTSRDARSAPSQSDGDSDGSQRSARCLPSRGRSPAVNRPYGSSGRRHRLQPPRPRSTYRAVSSPAVESDSDSDTVQSRSLAREYGATSPLCDFCHRRGHTERECCRANGLCFKCGASGHFARDCHMTRATGGAETPVSGSRRRSGSPRPPREPRRDSSRSTGVLDRRRECSPRARGGHGPAPGQPEN